MDLNFTQIAYDLNKSNNKNDIDQKKREINLGIIN